MPHTKPQFQYCTPGELGEAVSLLAEFGTDAYPIAGGTDLWVEMRNGKLTPTAVVSLRGIEELRGIRPEGEGFVLGAGTRHADVEDSAWVAERFPALHEACSGVGSRQVRNVATVGGNLCNAAPCADTAVALLLYDAVAVTQGPGGVREISLDDFFVAPGVTVLHPAELLTEIRVPAPEDRTFSGYWKHARRRGIELPLLGVGVRLALAEDGTVNEARIALGVAGPRPLRSKEAEAVLEGERLTEKVIKEAAETAAEKSQVRDSFRGRAWYRREMIRVLVPRVLQRTGVMEEV